MSIGTLLLGGTYRPGLGTGEVDERVVGTGDSWPSFPGIVDYNGFVMNDYTTADYYRISSIDGLDDAELRFTSAVKPNADGEEIYGSYYAGRTIVINGEIRASNLWMMDDMRSNMINAFARKDKDYPLRLHHGGAATDRFVMCRKNAKLEIPMVTPTQQQPVLPFMISLRAKDPRILSFLPETFQYEVGDPTFFSLTNEGNYEAKIKLRFYGPVTQFILTRLYDGMLKTVTVTNILNGNYVEINGARVTDQDGANAFGQYSDDSEIMLMGPGPEENRFDVYGTGASGAAAVSFEWNHSWVG